jgi:hypothetical protein
MNNRKNEVRKERQQQKLDAGFVSAHYPEVESIVINMTYSQKGIQKSFPRLVNFFPDSHAFFRISCLNKECIDGGFDLTKVITTMIGNRRASVKGELNCKGDGPSANHSAIDYEVAIQYV